MENLSITAIVLAGGLGSRMNGEDKGLLFLNGKPLYQHVIDNIKHQVGTIMINCNRHTQQYQSSGYSTFNDDFSGYLGPLSGIYSGLLRSKTEWNLFVSCDTPFLPHDLVNRLIGAITTHQAAYPFDGVYHHSTTLLINQKVIKPLKQYLEQGDRKLMLFLKQIDTVPVDFSDQSSSFININTPESLHNLEISTVREIL